MNKVEIRIDGSQVGAAMIEKFKEAVQPRGELFREVALDLIPLVHDRIHVQGLAADGTLIGRYSDAYMKVRTGNFGNAQKFKKGKNVGKNKDAGITTRGANKGAARSKYNRSADTKIIVSLTRQLENDYAVVPGEVGWGIGFNNTHNADKARWNDKRNGKTVYALTTEELDYAVKKTESLLPNELNK